MAGCGEQWQAVVNNGRLWCMARQTRTNYQVNYLGLLHTLRSEETAMAVTLRIDVHGSEMRLQCDASTLREGRERSLYLRLNLRL